MGKTLIIKGADFSENCISSSSLILDRTQQFNYAVTTSSRNSAPYADFDYAQLENHVITSLELVPALAGIISITKSTAIDSGGYEIVAQINVLPEHVGFATRYYISNIQVNAGEILGIYESNDTGRFKYINDSDEYTGTRTGFYGKVGSTNIREMTNCCLPINWYGYSL